MHRVTWHEYIYDANAASHLQSFDLRSVRGMPVQNWQHPSTTITHRVRKRLYPFFYKRLVDASMDANGLSPRYLPCHEGRPY
jgi:hypothetical protein